MKRAAALFIFIGVEPHTSWLPPSILRDKYGFVLTGEDLKTDAHLEKTWTLPRVPLQLETSVPGVFAVGDVRNPSSIPSCSHSLQKTSMAIRNRIKLLSWFLLGLVFTLLFSLPAFASESKSIQVVYLNVDQGNSTLIRDGNGYDVLVDGGKPSAGPTVVAYLHEQAVDSLEVIVASHADADHIGGLIDVLNAPDISISSVLYNGYSGDTETWTNFVNTFHY